MTTFAEACPCCWSPLPGTFVPAGGIWGGEEIECPYCGEWLLVEISGLPGDEVYTFTNQREECEE